MDFEDNQGAYTNSNAISYSNDADVSLDDVTTSNMLYDSNITCAELNCSFISNSSLCESMRCNGQPAFDLWSEYAKSMAPPKYAVPIYGFFSPVLILITVITNTLVCIVLMKKNMRSPTNTMLVAMAISDMLTGIFPLPGFIYFFTLGHWNDYVTHEWCYLFMYLTDVIPTIFHTASIWLTMGLAIQRYIYVCHSLKAKQWCTVPITIRGICLAYVFAVLSQLSKFAETAIEPALVTSKHNANISYTGCIQIPRGWIASIGQDVYYGMYYWFRVVFIHIVPCLSLVLLNAFLVLAMTNAQKRRRMLLKQNRKSESKRLKDSNCTTLMLVAVVCVFLLVEVPLGITFVLHIVQNTFDISIFTMNTMMLMSLFINFFILFSYPINFFIYCGMSRQFRETFRRLFSRGTAPSDREHSQYTALATENGKTAYTTQDTAI